jgi:hypothetical protein
LAIAGMENIMTTVLLHPQNLDYLKKLARERNPDMGSSHLTEAIAFGLGFNKHASLLSALSQPQSRLHAVPFSASKFISRLQQLLENKDSEYAEIAEGEWQLKQHELPISCYQTYPSDAVFHRYSRLNLPIIFKKDEMRKYCTLDYDYHFPRMHEVQKFDFEKARGRAIKQLFGELQRLKISLEMPKAVFCGTIVTGWVNNVPITKFDSFANSFALFYFNTIRDLECEIDKYRSSKAA